IILRAASSLHSLSFHATSPPAPYTLSLHDALPILPVGQLRPITVVAGRAVALHFAPNRAPVPAEDAGDRGRGQAALAEQAQRVRSEEHTSELQSRFDLVCRLLLEKKKKKQYVQPYT